MNTDDYQVIVNYVQSICGIVLGPDKRYLVEQRLMPILGELGCADLAAFADLLRRGGSYSLREKVLNAITTNETSFFRDEHPYTAFREKIIPELLNKIVERKSRPWQRRGPKVMLWSAACSTGQEPYSMAMLLHDAVAYGVKETVELNDFGILATDISPRVLARAMQGSYNSLEVARGLSVDMRNRHFSNERGDFVISEKLRHLVDFKSVNLQEPFVQVGSFDVIFCRNILIYFSDAAKRQILQQMYQVLAPDGILLLGTAENMYGFDLKFSTESYGSTVYYRKSC